MTTKLVQTLDTDAPLQEVFARWSHVALYGDIMPSLRNVRPLDDRRWLWEKDDGDWVVEDVQLRQNQLVSWRATSSDTDALATVLLVPLEGGKRTHVVYTVQYPHGLPPEVQAEALEAEMQTTLRRSAGMIDRPVKADATEDTVQPALEATQAAQEALAQVIESGETLHATLAEAADAWARSMTDTIKELSVAMAAGMPVAKVARKHEAQA